MAWVAPEERKRKRDAEDVSSDEEYDKVPRLAMPMQKSINDEAEDSETEDETPKGKDGVDDGTKQGKVIKKDKKQIGIY